MDNNKGFGAIVVRTSVFVQIILKHQVTCSWGRNTKYFEIRNNLKLTKIWDLTLYFSLERGAAQTFVDYVTYTLT